MELSVGQRIKLVRHKEAQDSFAVNIGISRGSLSSYERDESQPSAETLKNICAKYDILPEWLLMGTGPMKKEEGKAGSVPSEKTLDKGVLTDVVEILEESLASAKKKLPHQAKAELIYQLYQLVLEETDAKQQPIRIFRLIQGAIAANE